MIDDSDKLGPWKVFDEEWARLLVEDALDPRSDGTIFLPAGKYIMRLRDSFNGEAGDDASTD